MRDCPTVASKGRAGKQASRNVTMDAAPNKRRFYVLLTKG